MLAYLARSLRYMNKFYPRNINHMPQPRTKILLNQQTYYEAMEMEERKAGI